MARRSLHAHLAIELGTGLAGFAGLFIPIVLGQSIAAGKATSLWMIAGYVLLTLALGGLGLLARALGKELLLQAERKAAAQPGSG